MLCRVCGADLADVPTIPGIGRHRPGCATMAALLAAFDEAKPPSPVGLVVTAGAVLVRLQRTPLCPHCGRRHRAGRTVACLRRAA